MASSVDPAAPSSVEAELDELQRRYRMMESDRKAYADEVQNVVRKQKSQIDKLKRENAQLKQELQLQSRAGIGPDGSVGSTRVTRLQDQTDQITRSIETEKKRTDELDGRTRTLREGILQERRDMGGNNAPQEQNQAIGKQVKVLEHRLHRALIKFNEAIAANKDLREEIDNLRRERVVFDGIYKKLQHELAEKKKRMAEIIEVANVAYEARDRAQAEITSLKLQSEKEQAEFEGEWKELGRKLEEVRPSPLSRTPDDSDSTQTARPAAAPPFDSTRPKPACALADAPHLAQRTNPNPAPRPALLRHPLCSLAARSHLLSDGRVSEDACAIAD